MRSQDRSGVPKDGKSGAMIESSKIHDPIKVRISFNRVRIPKPQSNLWQRKLILVLETHLGCQKPAHEGKSASSQIQMPPSSHHQRCSLTGSTKPWGPTLSSSNKEVWTQFVSEHQTSPTTVQQQSKHRWTFPFSSISFWMSCEEAKNKEHAISSYIYI